MQALSGVGDRAAGEWLEWTGYAYHVRRRLTEAEQCVTGPAVDLRGTQEAVNRFRAAVEAGLPPSAVRLALEEITERAVC